MFDRYLNNPRLKAAGVKMEFTDEQKEEIKKCSQDPIYFIEKYIKIITLDHGLQPMKLYKFQKKLITSIWKNRFTIGVVGRQSGKCEQYDTRINIRNKKTGKIYEIKVGDYYEWLKFRNNPRQFLEEHNLGNSFEEFFKARY